MGPAPKLGQVIIGNLFSEPMRVETAGPIGDSSWRLESGRNPNGEIPQRHPFSSGRIPQLAILPTTQTFNGNGTLLRLGMKPTHLELPSSLIRTLASPSLALILCRTSSRPSMTTC